MMSVVVLSWGRSSLSGSVRKVIPSLDDRHRLCLAVI
jgi:hypothetical protein